MHFLELKNKLKKKSVTSKLIYQLPREFSRKFCKNSKRLKAIASCWPCREEQASKPVNQAESKTSDSKRDRGREKERQRAIVASVQWMQSCRSSVKRAPSVYYRIRLFSPVSVVAGKTRKPFFFLLHFASDTARQHERSYGGNYDRFHIFLVTQRFNYGNSVQR